MTTTTAASGGMVVDRALPTRRVNVTRYDGPSLAKATDVAAVEEPLQVCVDGAPFAVVMRTPGADQELVAGFLFSERVVRVAEEIGDISLDPRPGGGAANVRLRGAAAARGQDRPRRVTSNAACGLCGRQTLDELLDDLAPIASDWTAAAAIVGTLPRTMRRAQVSFETTGGLHAAGLFSNDGKLETVAEDVGRHNAVDKVVGRMLLAGRLPLAGHILFVSGRTSFEIVQKAWLAGIPVVGAVSAPSSLAIDLAGRAGITLLGFVRGRRFNAYSHVERLSRPTQTGAAG